ncbi:hypothetical protein [Belnapia moabensis]|uniref:hypothetical protein n=1 Tax=Belnapia moabensis TaxID=365533 RepID=UPI0012EEC036|nr:hypothetical protein [Belnapia moabensis]
MADLPGYVQKTIDQGFHAGRNGLPKTDNPHSGIDREHELYWNLGHGRGAEAH